MPVKESYVLASNRGGVGKTTTLCQLSAAYALAHPDVNVLVVDFSIHGDASSQLLGGTQEPTSFTAGVHTLGQQRAAETPPERTAAGLVAAALEAALVAGFARTTLRGFSAPAPAASASLDLSQHCISVAGTTGKAAPPNLFITPSVVNSAEDLSALEATLLDPGAACGCRNKAWEQAIAPLRAAMGSTTGSWVVFFDTDAELRERAPSRLALAVADRAVLLLSGDWRAYIRLKADSRNSLFRFLETLESEGKPHARIDTLLANAIPKKTGDPVAIDWPADTPSADKTPPGPGTPRPVLKLPFTPVAATQRELPQIAANMYTNADATPVSRALWKSEAAVTGSLAGFFDRYVRAICQFAPNVDQVTTGTGIPIVSLTPGKYTVGGSSEAISVDKAALETQAAALMHLARNLSV